MIFCTNPLAMDGELSEVRFYSNDQMSSGIVRRTVIGPGCTMNINVCSVWTVRVLKLVSVTCHGSAAV